MRLRITASEFSVELEGDSDEIRELLPDVEQMFSIGMTALEIRSFDRGPLPTDFHQNMNLSPGEYADFVRVRTGKRVETRWPICLNEPENIPHALCTERSVVF